FFFQAEDGIRDFHVTGVQTCALPIFYLREATESKGGNKMEQVLECETVYKESLGDCETVFKNNKRLIHFLIQKYFKNSTIEYDDLFQIGCIGFLKAYRTYDPNKLNTNGKSYKFTSYLSASLDGEIRRTLRDVYLGDGMRIPRK